MAPRIASDSYPDELLMIDVDDMGGVPVPIGHNRGGGGWRQRQQQQQQQQQQHAGGGVGGGDGWGGLGGGGAGVAINGGGVGGDNHNGTTNDVVGGGGGADDDHAAAAAAAANFATAMAMMDAGMSAETMMAAMAAPPPLATANGVGVGVAMGMDTNPSPVSVNGIENDPLSNSTGMTPAIVPMSVVDGLGGRPSLGPIASGDTMETTMTVAMAVAAERAWDQFVAGQQHRQRQRQQQQQQRGQSGVDHVVSPDASSSAMMSGVEAVGHDSTDHVIFGSSHNYPGEAISPSDVDYDEYEYGPQGGGGSESSTPLLPMVLGYGSHGNDDGHANNSPKLPYSPSLLDQTSLDEDDNMSLGNDTTADDDHSGNEQLHSSPISNFDWSIVDGCEGGAGGGGGGKAMNTTDDITADTTMDDSHVMMSSAVMGLSRVLASRAILEDSTAATVLTPPSLLRRRPLSFSSIPTTVGEASGSSAALQRQYRRLISDVSVISTPPLLSFGNDASISDLTYHAERGRIVDVLESLINPHLKTLGSRMLADYAKMPHRRVALASNPRILEFVRCTALEIGSYSNDLNHVKVYTSPTWLGREYAVETVRSLTAAEENDQYLMNSPGLLKMLALVARGGPFVMPSIAPPSGGGYPLGDTAVVAVPPPTFAEYDASSGQHITGVAPEKARLHACIAIMNLSCGKSNKVAITSVSEILEAMRDVMLGRHFADQPRGPSSTLAYEAQLKATTCIKNLSNADANDEALLGTPGLVKSLGYVAEATCHPRTGATTCTTHACLALMNLSISKANKNRVFRTPGVMDALIAVITRTSRKVGTAVDGEASNAKDPNFEARVKACSALSNLAIGYDNKIAMFNYPGLVESILTVVMTDKAEARTKACSIFWSFAAEMKNQVPVVKRGDIVPVLVAVAKEDTKTEARFKCVAALTLLAESPENAVPLLRAGSLEPLMNILQEAGPDPAQWRGQTASWCVGFLMNMAQCDDVVPALLQEGIVDLLAPLLSLDHYQSLKAAMAVTFVCQYDTGDKTYNLLRQTENVIPKIVGLLHNTLSGRGGSGYKYGVFNLRSSVGCIASLAAGPDFMKERIATNSVFESLLMVVEGFCVDGGTPGAIVGGGKDDSRSATLAVRALSNLIGHLIPAPGCAAMPFGPAMDDKLITAFKSFERSNHPEIDDVTLRLAHSARVRVEGGRNLHTYRKDSVSSDSSPDDMSDDGVGIGFSLARNFFPFTCGINLHVPSDPSLGPALPHPALQDTTPITENTSSALIGDRSVVETFVLVDSKTGRHFLVPRDPTGGRQFNDYSRVWCFRRGRYCNDGELPDTTFAWSDELQNAYIIALNGAVTDSSPER
ncbi:hypothetical protein ACHAXA_004213 [Cyclostephanos tholiformis]|uniref:Uncharacterized protein n=1 Tax=Cyclostephanos tholiformis TaxID=382380 RepID=A0ABD3RMF6_9STRA